jgi:hypothetical protein
MLPVQRLVDRHQYYLDGLSKSATEIYQGRTRETKFDGEEIPVDMLEPSTSTTTTSAILAIFRHERSDGAWVTRPIP